LTEKDIYGKIYSREDWGGGKDKKYLTKIKTCVIYRAKMESVDTFHRDKKERR